MTGLLYKELRQNRLILLGAVLIPTVLACFSAVSMLMDANSFQAALNALSGEDGTVMRLFMTVLGMILLALLTSVIFSEDESRKWAFFTASHPKGYRGQLYMKYVLLFMVFGLYFVSQYFCDAMLQMLAYQAAGTDLPGFANLHVFVFFIQLFMNAWNIPFMVRFGVKNSAFARCIALLSLAFLVILYLLFGPLPGSWNAYTQMVTNFLEKLMNGGLTGIISVILSAFPLAAVGLYLLSYRISCKLYMKGAAEYVK